MINNKDTNNNNAVIVGVSTNNTEHQQLTSDLKELELLLKTLNIHVVSVFVQKRTKLVTKSLLGKGKLTEIYEFIQQNDVDYVVFDHPLSPLQMKNIQAQLQSKIMDRVGVILDIFAQNARSSTAKIQVELAQLEYLLPKMVGAWTHFQRQKGGVRSRGMGEKQIEVDRRLARKRITALKQKLATQQIAHNEQRKSRESECSVALVGYTNSGKTTLINALTFAEFEAKDKLFATLDANTRVLQPNSRPKVLLSDTVGFIRKLPHFLVESFKTTLDVVTHADLILHVVDTSDSEYEQHMQVTSTVLNEIGAKDIPVLMVYSKLDLLDRFSIRKLLQATTTSACVISAFNKKDITVLRNNIMMYFDKKLELVKLVIPFDNEQALNMVYSWCIIVSVNFEDDENLEFTVKLSNAVLEDLQKFVVTR